MRTLDAVRERLGSVAIQIFAGYTNSGCENLKATMEGRPIVTQPRQATVAEYLDLIAQDLHTDWHTKFVLLYQPIGRKRAVLFPPEVGAKLQPVEIFSNIRLRDYSDKQRALLVEELGGYEAILEPGDTLAIPRMYWHHLDYLDTGITFRYGTVSSYCAYIRQNLHRDYYIQNFLANLLDDEDASPSWVAGFEELRAVVDRMHADPLAKYRAVRAVSRAICERILGDKFARPVTWLDISDAAAPIFAMKYSRPVVPYVPPQR